MAVWVHLVLLLALSGHSSAAYCICRDGLSDQVLQKTIDYACGSGADCSAILQSGACYQPNTVKDHCNYATNSYFQKMSQSGGTCDFSGTAMTSTTIPNQASGCVYPSSASTAGTSTTNTTTSGTNPLFGGSGVAPTGINDTSTAVGLFQCLSLAFSLFLLSLWLLSW
ncbi:hypothetical protein SAY87_028908 [Trapa incisa]|uniref:X8 domain-containing protein n=1 Tax=Trapa incisa TaxID=236973 RepID=A0AAN7KX60_9MYRT|nr:hypothetical protein SAY87_028908 [Trapa incisa]